MAFLKLLWVIFSCFFVYLIIFYWIPGCDFHFIGYWIFCILVDILELCSGTHLSYLERTSTFQILLLKYFRQGQSGIPPRTNYSPLYTQYTKKDPFVYSTQCPINLNPSSSSGLWEQALFLVQCKCWVHLPSILLGVPFHILGQFLHKYIKIGLSIILQGTSVDLQSSVSVHLSSFWCTDLQTLAALVPWPLSATSTIQAYYWALLRFLLPAPQSGSSLKTISYGNHRAHLFVSHLCRITVFD